MEVQPPLFVGVNGEIGAAELGLPFRDIFVEGVLGTNDLAPSAPGGMKVRIAAGAGWVKGDDDGGLGTQPTYRIRNDGNVDVNIAAADGANPRVDRIIARVYDAAFSGASYKWQLEVVQGVPTAGATLANILGAGAVPNTAMLLANVLVPAAAAAIIAGDILDVRQVAGAPRTTTGAFSSGPPLNPANGDIWDAVVDGSGTTWRFRYNAGSASAFKWEFIGGTPLAATNGVSYQNSVALAYQVPGSFGFVARAGDYIGTAGATFSNASGGSMEAALGLTVNGAQTGATSDESLIPNGAIASFYVKALLAGLGSGQVVDVGYWNSTVAGTRSWQNRTFSLIPRRVA